MTDAATDTPTKTRPTCTIRIEWPDGTQHGTAFHLDAESYGLTATEQFEWRLERIRRAAQQKITELAIPPMPDTRLRHHDTEANLLYFRPNPAAIAYLREHGETAWPGGGTLDEAEQTYHDAAVEFPHIWGQA